MCAGLAPSIPEDLYYLVKKAVSVRRHLEKNRKDKDSKFRLILVEVSFFYSFRFFHSYFSFIHMIDFSVPGVCVDIGLETCF
jgi:hypothetical protein